MSETKKILLVDDNYESIDFFRSMLEIMDKRFSVVSTPSAEEGWLEFRRGDFDLLVTDLRLPGMSGAELIKQVLNLKPGFPTILVSGYERDRLKAEIAGIDVYAFLEKPYETNELLKLMQSAVFGEAADTAEGDATASNISAIEFVPHVVPTLEVELSPAALDVMSNLKFYTGGEQVILGLVNGQIIHRLEDSAWLQFESLGEFMGKVAYNGLLMGRELKDTKSQSIHNLEAKGNVIFMGNVGQRYFVALFLDNRSERGRLGVIWVAIQRAIKDLSEALPDVQSPLGEEYFPRLIPSAIQQKGAGPASQQTKAAEPEPVPEPSGPPPEPEFVPLEEPIIDDGALESLLESTEWEVSDDGNGNFWEETLKEEGDSATDSSYLLSFDDALQQGFIDSPEAALVPSEATVSDEELRQIIPKVIDWESDTELDAFWDNLIEEQEAEFKSEGAMSLEEARKKGLLGSEIGQDTADS